MSDNAGDLDERLGIRESATSKRYVRALGRLKNILITRPGAGGEVMP